MFRVVSAILRPSPSRPSRFSTGTRTWWKRVTPFSRPFRPMKSLRFSTVTPSESVSTTNAVIPPLAPSCGGTWAITTTSSATTPLVVHSFTPSRVYAEPSSVGTAVLAEPGRVGADVGLGEQERRHRARRAAGQEPLLLVVGAERLDRLRDADRLVRGQQRADASGGSSRPASAPCRSRPWSARGRRTPRDLHAEGPDLRERRRRPRRGARPPARSPGRRSVSQTVVELGQERLARAGRRRPRRVDAGGSGRGRTGRGRAPWRSSASSTSSRAPPRRPGAPRARSPRGGCCWGSPSRWSRVTFPSATSITTR